MDLLPEKIPWGIIVGLGVLAVVWVVIAEKLDKAHFGINNASGPTPEWSPMPNTGQRPSTMYHGTKYLEWGKDILRNNRWKIGSSGGVYMAEDFNQAYQYSGIGGAIVELYVSPKANLSGGNGVWYADFPQLIGKYVCLRGITPKRLLDCNRNQVI